MLFFIKIALFTQKRAPRDFLSVQGGGHTHTENARTPADPVWPTPRAHVRTGENLPFRERASPSPLTPTKHYST